MKSHKLFLAVLATLATAGCAHPMNIKPDIQALEPVSGRIQKNVGLYISPAQRALEVTTAGGGGDKVKYHPYADMETGLYKALSNVFAEVALLTSPDDANAISKHSLSYVVEPTINTTSSSSGVFTWMATDVTVQVTCKVLDIKGGLLASVAATGIGKADSSEVRSDFSIAGERASRDALQKLETAFLEAPELRK